MARHPIVAAALATSLIVCSAPSGRAQGTSPTLTADQLMGLLGFDDATRRDLMAGEIVSDQLHETTKKELAATVAMLVKVPFDRVVGKIGTGIALDVDQAVLDHGTIRDGAAADFQGMSLGGDERGELEKIRKAKPGSKINLANAEFSKLAAAGRSGDAALQAYRAVLADRYAAYRSRGLAGVAPYDRGRKQASPAEELAGAAAAMTVLEERLPDFHRALVSYPDEQVPGMENRFRWLKLDINGRPGFVLAHRAWLIRPDLAVISERQFYVGHDYNSSQIIVGCFPVPEGTLVFYGNRTSTDQVAGTASKLAHKIGRGRMIKQVAAHFEAIRVALQSS